ncbi:M61 family metallopeptidase [Dyadobacter psychrotolerans]|uniref:Uncharacterized protein n=1 Tax=Dyadobacter psychrotolerans TaxID=2541721 RepID=A0A4R5DKY9_9BACT|nr:M1 family aminopeptidase [Dyadobacter psychrotolerans]TDE14872.1 hypothetical protein E0F88_16980 [Dyadobacter psychrotolerans]
MNNRLSVLLSATIISFVVMFVPGRGFAQQKLASNRLDYHLSWDGRSSLLKVDLFYNTHLADSTVFQFGNPNPGGLTNIFGVLQNIKADRNDSLRIAGQDRQIIVRHQTPGVKKLHYEIDGTPVLDPKRARPNEAFRPSITSGFFYSLGYNLFMDVADSSYTELSFAWDSWPENMPYFVSSDPKAKPNERQIVPNGERNNVLLQMNENLQRKEYVVNKIPTYLITSNSDSASDMQQGMDPLVTKFIPKVREFWQDYDFKFYFVSMIPLLTKVPPTMTGIGLKNGFGTRYTGALDTEKIATIAHEVSHTWIGGRMQLKSVGMENEWFNEGFNDYIAIYNLARAGLFDKAAFLKYTNEEILGQYYRNPENTTPGDSIEKNFWKSRNFEKIPYHRGFIYGFYLDNQIRLSSGSKSNIRDFLLLLYKQNRKNKKQVFALSDFTEALSAFLPKDQIISEIKTYMHQGKVLDFRTVKLIDAFSLSYQDRVPKISISDKVSIKEIYR